MRRIVMATVTVAALVVLFGCGSSEEYEDGFYFAEQAEFSESSGWKYIVMLDVEGGEIVNVTWTGVHREAGTDKITRSASGQYPMVELGGAQAPWHEQAALVEEYLLETQDPAEIPYGADGTTDAISGVSIHIGEFAELAAEALADGPVERGPYRDGAYSAEGPEFDHGWKDKVDITVIGGHIVAAHWNPYDENGASKYVESSEGRYGMVQNGGAQAPWHEQADLLAAALLESQDPTSFRWDDEGHTDAVSGVTIAVGVFFELAEQALARAR